MILDRDLKEGWWVFRVGKTKSEAHYLPTYAFRARPITPWVVYCRADMKNFTVRSRWSVVNDIGVIPLCEKCKKKLRSSS